MRNLRWSLTRPINFVGFYKQYTYIYILNKIVDLVAKTYKNTILHYISKFFFQMIKF